MQREGRCPSTKDYYPNYPSNGLKLNQFKITSYKYIYNISATNKLSTSTNCHTLIFDYKAMEIKNIFMDKMNNRNYYVYLLL